MDRPDRSPPSMFVQRWVPRLRARLGHRPRALDVACGTGRHATFLGRHGYVTFAVDRSYARISTMEGGNGTGLAIHRWVADLEDLALPAERFDLVLGTNYLQRDLWPRLRRAIAPGGFLVYETFWTMQLGRGSGPRSWHHLLQPGELLDVAVGWAVEWYEEVEAPVARARLVARKPR